MIKRRDKYSVLFDILKSIDEYGTNIQLVKKRAKVYLFNAKRAYIEHLQKTGMIELGKGFTRTNPVAYITERGKKALQLLIALKEYG